MTVKALQIVESAYRATLEEQDDTVIWITHAMKGAGAELDVLLQGNAVNYVVAGQGAGPLNVGGRAQKQSPDLAGDVAKLVQKGVKVYVVFEDLEDRGIAGHGRVEGLTPIARAEVANLVAGYPYVWHW